MIKKIKSIITTLILTIFLCSNIYSYANTFLDDKTMPLWKNEIGEFCIYLQNIENSEVKKKIEIISGQEYINNLKKVQGEYILKPETKGSSFPVCLELKLPKNVIENKKYLIEFGITDIAKDSTKGMVSIAPIQLKDKFYITLNLETNPNQKSWNLGILIGLFILLIILIYYILHKKSLNKNKFDYELTEKLKSKNSFKKKQKKLQKKEEIKKIMEENNLKLEDLETPKKSKSKK